MDAQCIKHRQLGFTERADRGDGYEETVQRKKQDQGKSGGKRQRSGTVPKIRRKLDRRSFQAHCCCQAGVNESTLLWSSRTPTKAKIMVFISIVKWAAHSELTKMVLTEKQCVSLMRHKHNGCCSCLELVHGTQGWEQERCPTQPFSGIGPPIMRKTGFE